MGKTSIATPYEEVGQSVSPPRRLDASASAGASASARDGMGWGGVAMIDDAVDRRRELDSKSTGENTKQKNKMRRVQIRGAEHETKLLRRA